MSLVVVIIILVVLLGGFGWSYRSGDAYPYRGYAGPSVGGLLLILLALHLLGLLHF